LLGAALAAAGDCPVLHCCAPAVPFTLAHRAGAAAVSCDVNVLDERALDELAAAVDSGLSMWPGVVPALAPDRPLSDRDLADRVRRLFRRLDQDPLDLAPGTVVTPTCGLAGADAAWARTGYGLAVRTAKALADSVCVDR
jgi:hypothetical protein